MFAAAFVSDGRQGKAEHESTVGARKAEKQKLLRTHRRNDHHVARPLDQLDPGSPRCSEVRQVSPRRQASQIRREGWAAAGPALGTGGRKADPLEGVHGLGEQRTFLSAGCRRPACWSSATECHHREPDRDVVGREIADLAVPGDHR